MKESTLKELKADGITELLTVELLKALPFRFHLHINGGEKYSRKVVVNDDWGLAMTTTTSGRPDYTITAKTLYMAADHSVALDMLKQPRDLEGFVARVNAKREELVKAN